MKRFARETPSSFDLPPAHLFFWPLEMMLRFQANVVNTLHETTAAWAQRRQEAAENAIETFDRLVHSGGIGEVITIQQQWFEGSIRRFDEDLNAIAIQSANMSPANMSYKAAADASEAVSRSVDAVREDARQSMGGNGQNPEKPNGDVDRGTHHARKQPKARKHRKRAR